MTIDDDNLNFISGEKRTRLTFFLAINLADYCTTAAIILSGGIEVMPVASGFIELYGLIGLFFHKLFITTGVCYLCRNMSNKVWKTLNWAFTLIVTWNSLQLATLLLEIAYSI